MIDGADDPLAAFVDWYLSAEHRDDPGSGCSVVALGNDVARASDVVRSAYTDQVRRYLARLDELLGTAPADRPSTDATAALATLVGAVLVARAVDDPELSERILRDARAALLAAVATRAVITALAYAGIDGAVNAIEQRSSSGRSREPVTYSGRRSWPPPSPTHPSCPPSPSRSPRVTGLDHHADARRGAAARSRSAATARRRGLGHARRCCTPSSCPGRRSSSCRSSDVELSGCNLSNVIAPRARWHRVHARGCRMTGILISGAVLSDVTFTDCRIDLASFGSSRLERVTFEGCRLAQTDFMESQLQDVRFERCDLTEEDFRGATLRRCEARGCELSAIQGAERLRGLVDAVARDRRQRRRLGDRARHRRTRGLKTQPSARAPHTAELR